MYNGVGLPTPRGSGTSGHIQRNLGQLPVRRLDTSRQVKKTAKKLGDRKPDKAILEHKRRRRIEAAILEYMEQFADEDLPQEELDKLEAKKRAELAAKFDKEDAIDRPSSSAEPDTHEQVLRKRAEDRKLRNAFGIKGDECD